MTDDIVRRLRAATQVFANEWHEECWEAAEEIEALRRVVFEACDVALSYDNGEPAYFTCADDYGDRVDSARFSPEQAAAVNRALVLGVPSDD